jgi:NACalpha-BTF3-like transcription factor
MRSPLLSRHKKAVSGNLTQMGEGIKSSLSDVRDFIDPREMDPTDVDRVTQDIEGYYEMYEIYGSQSAKFVADRVEEEPDKWDIDLDRIALSVIQEKVRKKYADNILPVINSYV